MAEPRVNNQESVNITLLGCHWLGRPWLYLSTGCQMYIHTRLPCTLSLRPTRCTLPTSHPTT